MSFELIFCPPYEDRQDSRDKVSYSYVPDQIGTLSQVGTKKISKGGWTI